MIKIKITELDLADFKEMEAVAIRQIKDGKKIVLSATELYTLAVQKILKLGGSTAEEEIEETRKQINSTADEADDPDEDKNPAL